ncbi:MAG: dihydropteroate synthase, partial [Candidatus Omnitrophica bacterium]|nr:dihydropteroate synthase [Candidatus Omnitrophota bacterium]
MGILNVTADSFSQDGIYKDPQRAKDRALQMAEDGAGIIDIGGESTRPDARPVSEEEEKIRVLPVIKALAKEIKIPISIDTTKAGVAQAALDEGASIINDISALRYDRQLAPALARSKAGCVLMHIQGTPQTMQQDPKYGSLIEEIIASLSASASLAQEAGIDEGRIVIDPGIGFGKTTEHNLKIIKHLRDFECLNLPVLIGASRKSFIGNVLNLPVDERIWGTAATVAASIFNGAHILRVHDVSEMAQITKMVDAILNS